MSLNVIVVGAGISGLCTAVALHQAGHLVKVRLGNHTFHFGSTFQIDSNIR
jgi:2-polyprenyl-6-methoxyphenol hydroxylase-like FAD-dependent oxidoreductase